jgi:hypothetical protein
MNFVVSYAYKEENQCANELANIDFTIDRLTIWFKTPFQIRSCFAANKMSIAGTN